MPVDKAANTNDGDNATWEPTHHVLACRGMPIPIRVTKIESTMVFYEDRWGTPQTCHIRDIIATEGK